MGVDGRDDERNKGVLSIVLGVREDRDFGLDEFHLNFTSYVAVEA
jgi:hypothetical protein